MEKKSQYVDGVGSYALAETEKPQKVQQDMKKEFVLGLERH